MKYYIIAGEASGDLHAARLMSELQKKDGQAEFRFFGGDKMQKVGGTLVKHYSEMAFMGFLPVILNIRTIKRNLDFCKKDILSYNPDAVILVDYPGFNLKIAEYIYPKGIKVFYFISPKVWAWKEHRVQMLKAFTTRLFCILPFEVEYFKSHNFEVDYVGNPLVSIINDYKKSALSFDDYKKENQLNDKPIIAILSGSRKQEVSIMLPLMLNVAGSFKEYQLVVAGVSSLGKDFYSPFLEGANENVNIVYDDSYGVLNHAKYALVTSGTATLETAIFGVPQIVCYRTKAAWLTYSVMKRILQIGYVSLVNLILDKAAVPELLMHFCTEKNLKSLLQKLIQDNDFKNNMLSDYNTLMQIMGTDNAAKIAANKMYGIMQGT